MDESDLENRTKPKKGLTHPRAGESDETAETAALEGPGAHDPGGLSENSRLWYGILRSRGGSCPTYSITGVQTPSPPKCYLLSNFFPEGDSLIAQLVKNPPAMKETLVQFLGWEDLLEKG